MGKACSTFAGEVECIQDFNERDEIKRPLGRPKHRCENSIKMDRMQ
jgi:hypothetical protein